MYCKSLYKRDYTCVIEKQIARYFVQYNECLLNPSSLLSSMQLK